MSKKNRRSVSRQGARPVARQSAEASAASQPAAKAAAFNPDYSYVIKDLRRIGILAGSFIVILVALSFFLR